jgi:hypothetical protein
MVRNPSPIVRDHNVSANSGAWGTFSNRLKFDLSEILKLTAKYSLCFVGIP